MMRFTPMLALAAALTLVPAAARAQSIHVSPMVGAYIPASDFQTLKGEAEEIRLKREATLGLGLILDLGSLRGTIAYATGTDLSEEGVGDTDAIGDGSLLALAADLVIRPVPRIVGIQPYLIGGAGLKRQSYSFEESGFNVDFPENETDFAFHFGVGADLMLGGLGIVAEFSDFATFADGDFGPHDAFATVGLRLRLF
jgi:hypothetical protein